MSKRVKKRLRKTTKSYKGLPEAKADRIAQLNTLVVVQHKGERAKNIQEALHTLLLHTDERHDTSPGGLSSSCYFQKIVAQQLEDSTVAWEIDSPLMMDYGYCIGESFSPMGVISPYKISGNMTPPK